MSPSEFPRTIHYTDDGRQITGGDPVDIAPAVKGFFWGVLFALPLWAVVLWSIRVIIDTIARWIG